MEHPWRLTFRWLSDEDELGHRRDSRHRGNLNMHKTCRRQIMRNWDEMGIKMAGMHPGFSIIIFSKVEYFSYFEVWINLKTLTQVALFQSGAEPADRVAGVSSIGKRCQLTGWTWRNSDLSLISKEIIIVSWPRQTGLAPLLVSMPYNDLELR